MLERNNSTETRLDRPRGARWPWLILAIAAGAVKARGIEEVTHHRPEVIAALALVLVASLLRPRPVLMAAAAAGLLAFALAPHPAGVGIAVGVGAFVVLMLVFFAIATMLHARQRH
ncbi:MAG: hypothetical protein JO286_17175 [Solirubrobacterales bacterium]|nr:hypothetical protein [Solirubrobacterales bacterium]MBV9364356.1 hypothetical protein [Solirubrobacterales bacterium]MBV9808919.1 hypothetical protein [Solirubrobacterales bacterium]